VSARNVYILYWNTAEVIPNGWPHQFSSQQFTFIWNNFHLTLYYVWLSFRHYYSLFYFIYKTKWKRSPAHQNTLCLPSTFCWFDTIFPKGME
jgi:hypothetical protein